VGDGGVVENERPAYASQHAFKNGKRTNMLLLLLLLLHTVSDTRTRVDQRTPTCGGDGDGGGAEVGGRKGKYMEKTEV
jgi:hypothetical protein